MTPDPFFQLETLRSEAEGDCPKNCPLAMGGGAFCVNRRLPAQLMDWKHALCQDTSFSKSFLPRQPDANCSSNLSSPINRQ